MDHVIKEVMRIAVNARFLCTEKPDGTGRYSIEILKRLCRMHPEHQFIFFMDRSCDPWFIYPDNVIPVVIRPRARHPLLWLWWFEIALFKALKKYNPDLFFSPDGFLSLRTGVPSVIVMHDINFFHNPYDLPLCVRRYYSFFFPRYAGRAEKICTVSEYSKNDISSSFHIPLHKIEIHYNGISEIFSPLDRIQKQKMRDKLTGGKPYFIYIGSLHPRKNLVNLLKGFEHFMGKTGKEFKLVIAGREFFLNSEMKKVHRGMVYRDDVIFTGYLPERNIAEVLASAEALIMVSFYEGFGLPVVEAMKCDVPVIASNNTAIPEIAGDAAIYVDPGDYMGIGETMIQLVSTVELKESLIVKGRKRSSQFSWDKTAEGLWKTIDNILVRNAQDLL